LEDLREKLQTEIEQADWDMLASHHKAGVVFFIAKDIDLLDAAIAVARDDKENVAAWLKSGHMKKPTDDEAKEYDKNPYEKIARFVIIQPFVIAQLLD